MIFFYLSMIFFIKSKVNPSAYIPLINGCDINTTCLLHRHISTTTYCVLFIKSYYFATDYIFHLKKILTFYFENVNEN